ncbi:MAG: DUF3990 domain-containing protein [Synergistaceae bacterium]|nr:DUF3990 domain-containing protein [Synergistaceae bacterium]
MLLYHGSNVEVKIPQLIIKSRGLDFGSGFYLTSNREQAEEFSEKVARRNNSDSRIVSVFEYIETASEDLSILSFYEPSIEWLDFTRQNRLLIYSGKQYDIIIGPVANDDIYPTLQLYWTGAISADIAIAQLKVKPLFNQYCFLSEMSFECLQFNHSFSTYRGGEISK